MFGLIHGLYEIWTKKSENSILFLGLDGAGKTSILNKIEQTLYESGSLGDEKPKPSPIIPTVGQNSKLIKTKECDLRLLDLGGSEKVRGIWNDYVNDTDSIIFVIDGTNESRLKEVTTELTLLRTVVNNRNLPFVILLNKQDQESFLPQSTINSIIGETVKSISNCYVEKSSAVTGLGLIEALSWILHQLKEKKK